MILGFATKPYHIQLVLFSSGMSDDQLDKLLRKHNQELENLRESQQVQKERQLAKVKVHKIFSILLKI